MKFLYLIAILNLNMVLAQYHGWNDPKLDKVYQEKIMSSNNSVYDGAKQMLYDKLKHKDKSQLSPKELDFVDKMALRERKEDKVLMERKGTETKQSKIYTEKKIETNDIKIGLLQKSIISKFFGLLLALAIMFGISKIWKLKKNQQLTIKTNMSKSLKILVGIYLLIGIVCSTMKFTEFSSAISTYNLPAQLSQIDYFQYGKKLIQEPAFVIGSKEEKDYNVFKLISETDLMLEGLTQDDFSVAKSFAKFFGYTFPFVIVLLLFLQKNRLVKIFSVVLLSYLITSIIFHKRSEKEFGIIKNHFQKLREQEVKSNLDSFLRNN